MKTYKDRKQPSLHSVVIPFPNTKQESEEDLFDDCPVCQLLKQQIERGEVEEVSVDLGDEDWEPVRG
jgi:hypothetical protein